MLLSYKCNNCILYNTHIICNIQYILIYHTLYKIIYYYTINIITTRIITLLVVAAFKPLICRRTRVPEEGMHLTMELNKHSNTGRTNWAVP